MVQGKNNVPKTACCCHFRRTCLLSDFLSKKEVIHVETDDTKTTTTDEEARASAANANETAECVDAATQTRDEAVVSADGVRRCQSREKKLSSLATGRTERREDSSPRSERTPADDRGSVSGGGSAAAASNGASQDGASLHGHEKQNANGCCRQSSRAGQLCGQDGHDELGGKRESQGGEAGEANEGGGDGGGGGGGGGGGSGGGDGQQSLHGEKTTTGRKETAAGRCEGDAGPECARNGEKTAGASAAGGRRGSNGGAASGPVLGGPKEAAGLARRPARGKAAKKSAGRPEATAQAGGSQQCKTA